MYEKDLLDLFLKHAAPEKLGVVVPVITKQMNDRVLSDLFFTLSQYAEMTVNWLDSFDQLKFQSLYDYKESSPNIWSKEEMDSPSGSMS